MELKTACITVAVIQYITSTPHHGGYFIHGCFETPQPVHQLQIQNTTRSAKLQVVFDVIIKLGIEKREDNLI